MENVRQRRNISEQNDKTSEKKTPSNKKSDSNRRWLRVVSFIPFIVLLAIQLAYLLSPISAVYIEGIEPIQFDGPFAVNTKLSVGKRYRMQWCMVLCCSTSSLSLYRYKKVKFLSFSLKWCILTGNTSCKNLIPILAKPCKWDKQSCMLLSLQKGGERSLFADCSVILLEKVWSLTILCTIAYLCEVTWAILFRFAEARWTVVFSIQISHVCSWEHCWGWI